MNKIYLAVPYTDKDKNVREKRFLAANYGLPINYFFPERIQKPHVPT